MGQLELTDFYFYFFWLGSCLESCCCFMFRFFEFLFVHFVFYFALIYDDANHPSFDSRLEEKNSYSTLRICIQIELGNESGQVASIHLINGSILCRL